jgi:hypothetical protein
MPIGLAKSTMVAAHGRLDQTHAFIYRAAWDDMEDEVAGVRGVKGKG